MTCVADPLTNGGEVSLTTSISRVVLQVMSLSLSFPSEMLPPSVLKFDLVFLSTIKGSSHRHPAPETLPFLCFFFSLLYLLHRFWNCTCASSVENF